MFEVKFFKFKSYWIYFHNKIPTNTKINGEITNFKIEIVVVNLFIIFLVLNDKIMPIANKPTGDTQAVSLERV